MCPLILLILPTFLSASTHVIQASAVHLQCFNDYNTKMECHFISGENFDCSEYKLNILQKFTCLFEKHENPATASKCGCTVEMPMFIIGEIYCAELLKNGDVVQSINISAANIKPKPPTIQTVQQKENGNVFVNWTTNYHNRPSFSEYLTVQLSYRKKGETKQVLVNTTGFYEILKRDMESNGDYVLKARSYNTAYGHLVSDWSEEREWTYTASFLRDAIVIVLLFVVPVVVVVILFSCYLRIKAKWWKNILKPTNLFNVVPGVSQVLDPQKTIVSAVHVNTPKMEEAEEKQWTPVSDVSGDTINTDLDSSSSNYAHPYPQSLDIVYQMHNAIKNALMPLVSGKPLPHAASTDVPCSSSDSQTEIQSEYNGLPCYSNKTYLSSRKNVCDGGRGCDLRLEPDTTPLMSTSPSSPASPSDGSDATMPGDVAVGYQSFGEAAKGRALERGSNPDGDVEGKLVYCGNPLNASKHSQGDGFLQCDGDQAVHDMAQNGSNRKRAEDKVEVGEWNLPQSSTGSGVPFGLTPAVPNGPKQPMGSLFPVENCPSPVIQVVMDYTYHRV